MIQHVLTIRDLRTLCQAMCRSARRTMSREDSDDSNERLEPPRERLDLSFASRRPGRMRRASSVFRGLQLEMCDH